MKVMNSRLLLTLPLLVGLNLGCAEKNQPTVDPASTATAGNKNKALVDNKVKAAMKDVKADPSAAVANDGPPSTGIFAAGDGAKALARDGKLNLVDKGTGTKVKVGGFGPIDGAFLLQVTQSSQPGGTRPVVDYTIKVRGPKPEKADAEAAPSATAAPSAGAIPVSFVIAKAKPAPTQQGQLPEGFGKMIASVEGSRFDVKLAPNGGFTEVKTVYGKGIEQAIMREFVDMARASLTLFFPAMPIEPVGKGGFWIRGDKANLEGMDLLRYRVTKLSEVQADLFTFEIDVRHYVADPFQVPNLARGKGLAAKAFEGPAKGVVMRKKGSFIPDQAEVVSQMVVYLADPENPQQAQPVQFSLRARLAGPKPAEEPAPK